MNGSHLDKRIVLTVAGFALTLAISSSGVLAGTSAGLGPGNAHRPMRGVEMLRHWNHIAIDMSGLDHTPVAPGEARVFGEELGPVRASRAMAIVHIAIFDAINAIHGGYRSYTGIPAAPRNTSVEAAIAEAAHDTLVELFPSQTAACDAVLADDLGRMPAGLPRKNGIDLGRRAAAAILAMRANDHSDGHEPRIGVDFFPGVNPGEWRQDPISLLPVALGAHSGEVTPFVLTMPNQFRVPLPPALDSQQYAIAYNEVKQLGGDGVVTPTSRTADQTVAGIFWAYDGTPSLCAPPRLYNQIAMQIAGQMGIDMIQTARLLALVNTAMADAGIAVWESKYYYQFWRPVAGIRESDPGTGPTGAGDGNPDTAGDITFSPLGAPASNLAAVNFTPPFPAYPSGHAGFGGALFETLRNFFGTDDIAFTFVSDEFNGSTKDRNGNVRPLVSRTFNSLSQAEEENGQSRIYLGIHWAFDKTGGIAAGNAIANFVFDNVLRPRGHAARGDGKA
ncbi:MAG TPA: phosphatase PAP2 family protein, partial [Patescibacteria group bacterium]|nr:phosphatase PAP2 family protein [Patescibacteria group bacterium]